MPHFGLLIIITQKSVLSLLFCFIVNVDILSLIIVFSILQGAYFAWKATAMGKNFVNGKTFLEKRFVLSIKIPNLGHQTKCTAEEIVNVYLRATTLNIHF